MSTPSRIYYAQVHHYGFSDERDTLAEAQELATATSGGPTPEIEERHVYEHPEGGSTDQPVRRWVHVNGCWWTRGLEL